MKKDAIDHMDSLGNRDNMVDIKEELKMLPVPLTEREKLELGENLAQGLAKIDLLTINLKSKQSEIKADIEQIEERCHLDASVLRAGTRDTEVKCEVQRNYRTSEIVVVRLDTMAEVKRRPMTSEERQMGLKL